MADLSNPLTQVSVAQEQPAVTVNNLVDALSPAACFGQNDLTTSALNWGYYGGRFGGLAIAHGTLALPANEATIYIVANKSTGVVSQSTSITNWNDDTNYQRLHIATTGAATITDWDDYREFIASGIGGGAAAFTDLTDVPGSYSGESLKVVRVNVGETALEFAAPSGGVTDFTDLGDVPASYTGESLQAVRVNVGETALEFYTPASGSVATDTIFDAKGDLAVGTGADTAAKLAATTNGFVLTLDSVEATGMKWAAGGSGTPAGSTTEIQYNNAGAFGASSKFTWNDTTRTLSVNHGTDNTGAIIQCPAQTTNATAGQALTVRSAAGLTSGNGGALALTAGAGGSSGSGGAITATAGVGATNGAGGHITLNAGVGAGSGLGGSLTLQCGAGGTTNGTTGGAVTVTAGAGPIGGGMVFTTGTSSQAAIAGGNFRFIVGAPGSGTTYGKISYERSDATQLGTWFGNGNLNIGPTTTAPTVKLLVEGAMSMTSTAQNAATTTTINLATTNVHKIAMGANITTLTVSNPTDNQQITILFTQDGTGNRTCAFPASFKWAGGVTGVLSTAAAAVDMLTGTYNSTTGFYYVRLEKAFA